MEVVDMVYDYLIVGAGLYGAVFAHEALKDNKKVLIIDRRDHIGGNVYTEDTDGITVHKYGAHIFNTDSKEIWEYVNSLVEFNHFVNSPIAVYKNKMYNLPFNMNTFYNIWGLFKPDEVKNKIKEQQCEITGEPKNLEEQAIKLVGSDIYKILVKEYTEKQWGRSCSELPADIIKRLPIRMTFDNNYYNKRYQGIPVGGYTKLIDKLIDRAEVRLGCDYLSNKEYYNSICNKVVFTGAIDEYFEYSLGKLEYRTLRFEHKHFDIDNYQGNAVVNYTSNDVAYTRTIEHKHFDRDCKNSNKTIVSYEYPMEYKDGLEQYYPINDNKNNDLYNKYCELSKYEDKVIFGGRLGEYKYYNMDDVIQSALNKYKEVGGNELCL